MSTNTLGAEILRVIADEIGGYEVTHPAMRGATAAIHARVMITLHERAQELEADKARLDWLEKLATDGEDSRSIEVQRIQKSNRKNRFWSWPIMAIDPVGERVIGIELNRYSSEIRPGYNDEEYGGHWDVQCVEGQTIRAAIDAAMRDTQKALAQATD